MMGQKEAPLATQGGEGVVEGEECVSHLCGTKHLRSAVMTVTLTTSDLFTVRQCILHLAPRAPP